MISAVQSMRCTGQLWAQAEYEAGMGSWLVLGSVRHRAASEVGLSLWDGSVHGGVKWQYGTVQYIGLR
jgi:hypothetical protein